MLNKKRGAYYTPDFLADFIMRYTSAHFQGRKSLSILEPSVGDGSFIRAFNNIQFPQTVKTISFTAVEKIKIELEKAKVSVTKKCNKQTKYLFLKDDFLKFQQANISGYSFIVGNPPYIRKSLLNKTQIAICEKIHSRAGIGRFSVKNIWPYFLIRGCELLDNDGVLAFILPSELLQTSFSKDIREYLTTQFNRIEIFTFDDLLFECKGQDTTLLIGYKKHTSRGQFYTHIRQLDQLQSNDFVLNENKTLKVTDTKWIHHSLSSDELTFIHNVGKRLKPITDYCESKPGIVTAVNKFFIVNTEVEHRYELSNYLRPIIQKGIYVNGSVVFDEQEFQGILHKNKPCKVLCISDEDRPNLPSRVKSYLHRGAKLKLQKGYKCAKRKHWYIIPNVTIPPEAFFFRRVHNYPKLIKNEAKVLVTDTAYEIKMKIGSNIDSLIHSFYNSLTLSFAELNGRYYGGGVLELTPSEFKSLPIPYCKTAEEAFTRYRLDFENKSSINDILNTYDHQILGNSLNLSAEEIQYVQKILRKLISKRLRE